MADENPPPVPAQEDEVPPERHSLRKLWYGLGALLAAILLVIGGGVIWLDSQSGHRFVARQIAGMTFQNGMTIAVGRIDGSIYNRMILRDVAIGDPRGKFISFPQVKLDWHPFAYLSNHIDIESLRIPEARLMRLPAFRTVASNEPLLPDIDIDVGRLEFGRIDIDPGVTGKRHLLTFAGSAHIADRRAQIRADARALSAPGVAGGDRLILMLDAVPDKNRLALQMELTSPADGLLASYTGKAAPVTARLNGKGDWSKWDGKFDASYGSDELAGLLLTARGGTLAMRGHMQPGLLLGKTGTAMLDQPTNVDLTAKLDQRRADLSGTVGNANFGMAVKGLVDLGRNRFENLALDLRVLHPAAIAPGTTGENVGATLLLDGAFATPKVAYTLTAARLGFGDTAIVGLRAKGEGRVDADKSIVPIHATATRIVGLDAAAGELLTNVRVDGDLAIQGTRILSDNLLIRSDRIDAKAVLVADLSTGLYTGALNGKVGNYRVDGVGRFDIASNLDLKTEGRIFRIAGTVTARSREIFNSGAREFLGGNALLSANVSYGTDGVARISGMRVAAPQFRMASGEGSYSANGQIRFKGRGISDRYGPLSLDLTGTLARPVAVVLAERPGFGVGMANVRAELRGTPQGYALKAAGGTDYGPFDADVVILSGKGPLTIDVQRANFGGVGLAGRIQQSAAGPFTGTLSANGSGIIGTVQLLGAGKFQRLIIAATANQAQLPGPAGLSIGRAIIAADVTLYDRPEVKADIQLADFRMKELVIDRGRAKIDYRGGSGTAQLFANGSRGTSFQIAANAQMTPTLWRVAAQGNGGGIGFRTVAPARIEVKGATYELLPTRIVLRQGSVQIAGRYDEDLVIQSRLTAVDLGILRPMFPTLGLGGTATGSLDFEQRGNAFPHADARLTLNDFTRTGLASVSQPVDVKLVGRLLPDGGNMRAIVQRKNITIGHMQVDLRPLGPDSGTWQTRLMAAPLSGGVRYNGPASTLFSLAALADQHLVGAIGVAADFSGRVQAPVLTGVVRANDVSYVNDSYGTRLTHMRLRGTFTNDRLEVSELTAQAGNGTVSGSGFVSLSSEKGYPLQLNLKLDNAQIADTPGMATRATGELAVVNGPDQPPTITGRIELPETRYRIVRQGAAQVKTLTGIRRKSDPARAPAAQLASAEIKPKPVAGVPSNWRLQIDIVADNRVFVSGMGIESEWGADIKLRGTTGSPRILGGLTLKRGTLGFAGRSFKLQEGGTIRFNDGNPANPSLSLSAEGDADNVTITVNLSGSALDPQITFSSTPALPQDEIMARILFGNSIGELSTVQAVQLAASLNSLRGGGGLNPLGVLQSAAGIDRLRILGEDKATGRGTAVAVGKYITNDIYVEVVTDARGYTASQIEISLTPALSVLSQVGSFGGSNVSVQYRKNY